jgi:hypothetical protein
MAQLSLVKTLSHLQEEQKNSQIYLEIANLRLLRGSLTEFVGKQSTGKTSLAYLLLAALTQKGEICAIVDLNNGFNPRCAENSDVILEDLLWIKCGGNIEHAFKAVDHLIQAKNFGLIWLDLSDHLFEDLHFIPSSYWYRFRTRIKESQTLLIVTANQPLLGAASSQSYLLSTHQIGWSGAGCFKLIKDLQIDLNTKKPFFIKPELLKIEARY